MESALQPVIGYVIVLLIPGLALAKAFYPRGAWLQSISTAPLLSFFLIFVYSEASRITGLPFVWYGFAILVLPLISFAIYRFIRSNVDRDQQKGRPPFLALGLLGLGLAVGCTVWISILSTEPLMPPNFDASHHGFVTARTLLAQTTDPGTLLATDYGHRPTAYYPPGLHAGAALIVSVSGSTVGDALLISTIIPAAIFLGFGMFMLSSWLVPDRPLVAGFSALFAPTVGIFPYKPMLWGGMPLIIAMSFIPVAVAFTVQTLTRKDWDIRDILLSAALAVAIFSIHTNEVALLLILVVFLSLPLIWRSVATLKVLVVRSMAVGAVATAFILPSLPGVLGAASEAQVIDDKPAQSMQFALGNILTLNAAVPNRQLKIALLAAIGIAVAIRIRRAGGLIAAGALTLGLYTLAATKGPAYEVLTLPWFRQDERIAYNLAVIVPLLAGIGVGEFAIWLGKALRGGAGVALQLALIAATVLIVVLPAGTNISRWVGESFIQYSPVGRDEVAAFRFLAGRVHPGERVLNDFNSDGSIWMFSRTSRVMPLFALPPPAPGYFRPGDERILLLNQLASGGEQETELIEKFCVTHVYFGEDHFADAPHTMNLSDLRVNPRLRQVFSRGDAHVFELNPPPRCD